MPFIQIGGWRGGQKSVEPVLAEIDEEDVEKVEKFVWSQNKHSSRYTIYAQSTTGGKKIHLHRLIMGLGDFATDKRIVDHKDGNGLNNKKNNLTVCDTLYNSQSFRRHNGNCNIGCIYIDTSMTRLKRWKAVITINGVRFQKRFLKEQEANDYIQTFNADLGRV